MILNPSQADQHSTMAIPEPCKSLAPPGPLQPVQRTPYHPAPAVQGMKSYHRRCHIAMAVDPMHQQSGGDPTIGTTRAKEAALRSVTEEASPSAGRSIPLFGCRWTLTRPQWRVNPTRDPASTHCARSPSKTRGTRARPQNPQGRIATSATRHTANTATCLDAIRTDETRLGTTTHPTAAHRRLAFITRAHCIRCVCRRQPIPAVAPGSVSSAPTHFASGDGCVVALDGVEDGIQSLCFCNVPGTRPAERRYDLRS